MSEKKFKVGDRKFNIGERWKDREGNVWLVEDVEGTVPGYPIECTCVESAGLSSEEGDFSSFTEEGWYMGEGRLKEWDLVERVEDKVERVCVE